MVTNTCEQMNTHTNDDLTHNVTCFPKMKWSVHYAWSPILRNNDIQLNAEEEEVETEE